MYTGVWLLKELFHKRYGNNLKIHCKTENLNVEIEDESKNSRNFITFYTMKQLLLHSFINSNSFCLHFVEKQMSKYIRKMRQLKKWLDNGNARIARTERRARQNWKEI